MKVYYTSDQHYNHRNMIEKFKQADGSPARPFSTVEEMNETMIENHNRVVNTNDKVIMLGDLCMNSGNLDIFYKLKGYKELVLGNHDGMNMSEYLKHFRKVSAYRTLRTKDGLSIVFSHIPIHPESLSRWQYNFHGHTHLNSLPDKRYVNLCVEMWDYRPVTIETILHYIKTGERNYDL